MSIQNLLHNNAVKSVSPKASDWACFELDCTPWGDSLDLISITETEDYYFAVAIYWDGVPKTFCCSKKIWSLWMTLQSHRLKIAKIQEDIADVKEKQKFLKQYPGGLMNEIQALNYKAELKTLENSLEVFENHQSRLQDKFDTIRKEEK